MLGWAEMRAFLRDTTANRSCNRPSATGSFEHATMLATTGAHRVADGYSRMAFGTPRLGQRSSTGQREHAGA